MKPLGIFIMLYGLLWCVAMLPIYHFDNFLNIIDTIIHTYTSKEYFLQNFQNSMRLSLWLVLEWVGIVVIILGFSVYRYRKIL